VQQIVELVASSSQRPRGKNAANGLWFIFYNYPDFQYNKELRQQVQKIKI
jgi:hypothetical protein